MSPTDAAGNLRRWNIALAILHAAQGIAILLLSNGFTLGVTIPYMIGPPGSPIDPERFCWALRGLNCVGGAISRASHFPLSVMPA